MADRRERGGFAESPATEPKWRHTAASLCRAKILCDRARRGEEAKTKARRHYRENFDRGRGLYVSATKRKNAVSIIAETPMQREDALSPAPQPPPRREAASASVINRSPLGVEPLHLTQDDRLPLAFRIFSPRPIFLGEFSTS